MTPVVPIIWLPEIANGENILEKVNILSNLARIQHLRQRIESREHERRVDTTPYNSIKCFGWR